MSRVYKLVAHIPAESMGNLANKGPWECFHIALNGYKVANRKWIKNPLSLGNEEPFRDWGLYYRAGMSNGEYFVYQVDNHTAEQRKLIKWVDKMPPLTERQFEYAKRHCFSDLIVQEYRGWLYCPNTNKLWHENANITREWSGVKRPQTNYKKAEIVHGMSITIRKYFLILTTKGGYQVARWFCVEWTSSLRDRIPKVEYTQYPVGVEFLSPSGKRITFERARYRFSYWQAIDNWSVGDKRLHLRRGSVFARDIDFDAVLHIKVLPVLRRNGFIRNFPFKPEWEIEFMQCLFDNNFESWFKTGNYGVCQFWMKEQHNNLLRGTAGGSRKDKTLSSAIKLANRHHVTFDSETDWTDFKDYLQDLVYLGKDIHNPTILFPADKDKAYAKVHDKARKRRNEIREREIEEQRVRDMQIAEEKDKRKREWIAKYRQMFQTMNIEEGEFTIKPLITTNDFEAEADHQHHCICTYYGKSDTLLLSIEHNGEKAETAEINLLGDGEIVQCRGKYNQPTEWHAHIVELLAEYLNVFVKRYNKVMRGDIIVNLPAPINHYKIAV